MMALSPACIPHKAAPRVRDGLLRLAISDGLTEAPGACSRSTWTVQRAKEGGNAQK